MATDPKTGQNIFGGSYGVGFNNVGSYQASARPWVASELVVPASSSDASTALEISFPKVTKFVTIRNDGSSSAEEIRIAFASGGLGTLKHAGSTNNYIKIAQSSSFSADFRVTKLYLMSNDLHTPNATVIAGLTQINASHLSNSWKDEDGVGD
tara:strand:- start:1078 stop:1536 length:459 start_codon:yes stop_codon:yes gene_type:complete